MKTKDIVYIALFAAIIAGLALFPKIPLPGGIAPISAQSLGVMLAGSILGAKRGGLSILLFVLLVAIGLPLLSGGRGGLGPLTGAWSGYIYGWVIAAFVIGWLVERNWQKYHLTSAIVFNIIGGIIIVYACGLVWFSAVSGTNIIAASISAAVYLPGDIVKVLIASFAAVMIKKSYPLIRS